MIIAHDLGTTGNKASLHDPQGKTLATYKASYSPDFGPAGHAEQDPEIWWAAVGDATRKLLALSNTDPARISGLVLSGQMQGAVFLDAAGEPVRAAMIWADHRSTEQADRLIARIGMEDAYKELGHRISPTYTLAKVMWVRENEPETWARVRSVCLCKDFINLRLTGKLVTDPSDASATNAFDQVAGVWSSRLMEAAELPTSIWPEIVPSTAVIGGLTTGAANYLGLIPGTPVVVGGGDGPMAGIGAGIVSKEDGLYASLGSSSWIATTSDEPLHDPAMRTMTFNHVIPGAFAPMATMQMGGASLQWAVEVFGRTGTDRDYLELLAGAAGATAAEEGLYFLPHLMGERSPYWNPSASGVFAGLSRHHTREHMVRAVLEGVAFNLRTCLNAFTEAGFNAQQIDAIGGSARSTDWLQIMANIWGIKVRSRDIIEDANSLGAAVTGLVGLGMQPDFSVARTLSKVTIETAASEDQAGKYADLHQNFLYAYQSLEPWFDSVKGKSTA